MRDETVSRKLQDLNPLSIQGVVGATTLLRTQLRLLDHSYSIDQSYEKSLQ